MGELIRDISQLNLPLCPQSMYPVHESHMLKTRILDAFYSAVRKDENGEMPEPAEKAYRMAEEMVSDRMYLYRDSASFIQGNSQIVVEAWWFRCPTCGLILPANRKQAP